jgi:hypothetical protein
MSKELLEQFERAIRKRNPALADSLQPSLPEATIREMLQNADVRGHIEPILSFFAWKNGTALGPDVTLGEASPFPESIYCFADLNTMIDHFAMFHEGFVHHPKFEEVDGRYFPLFWDNCTGYLAIDLRSPKHRVVLLEPESEDLAGDAYSSFEEFLQDAIRANEEDDNLVCFQVR